MTKQRAARRDREQGFERNMKLLTLSLTVTTTILTALITIGVAYYNHHVPERMMSVEDEAQVHHLTDRIRGLWKVIKTVPDDSAEWETLHQQREDLEMQRWKILVKYNPTLPPPGSEFALDLTLYLRPWLYLFGFAICASIGSASMTDLYLRGGSLWGRSILTLIFVSIGIWLARVAYDDLANIFAGRDWVAMITPA